MREIKFRAKSRNYNEWVYGYLIETMGDFFIKAITKTSEKIWWIQEETIGQFTRTT